MVKDRLEELRKLSGYSQVTKDTIIDLDEKNKYSTIDSILAGFVEIRTDIISIGANLNTMRRNIQTTELRNLNGDEMDKLRINNLSLGQKLIYKFNELKKQLPLEDDYSLEARIKRTLFYGMHREYINIWESHEMILENYESKLKKNLQLHSKILNYKHSEEEVEELISKKQASLFVDNILEETEKERHALRDLLHRYSELERLEKSIEEVHALFLRIQNLVIEQNDKIQLVEYHAQQASAQVDKGTDNLEKAKKLKTKTNKLKLCLILSALSFFLIVVIFAFLL